MAEVIVPPWLPDGLYQMWLAAYNDAGGAGVQGSGAVAVEVVRTSPEYDAYFPGLRRDDGSLRYSDNPEATYFNNLQGFRNIVEEARMNPDIFEEDYIALISGDVSISEFANRVDAMYSRVINNAPEISAWYSTNHGLEMTGEAILASMMSERVNNAVLLREITMAEIGGEASMRDFDITSSFVDMLTDAGMNRNDAQTFFGSAERLLPTLSALAARHGDSDDDFDLLELAQGTNRVADTSGQGARIKRLRAQESSNFTGGAQTDIVRSRESGLTGLVDV